MNVVVAQYSASDAPQACQCVDFFSLSLVQPDTLFVSVPLLEVHITNNLLRFRQVLVSCDGSCSLYLIAISYHCHNRLSMLFICINFIARCTFSDDFIVRCVTAYNF